MNHTYTNVWDLFVALDQHRRCVGGTIVSRDSPLDHGEVGFETNLPIDDVNFKRWAISLTDCLATLDLNDPRWLRLFREIIREHLKTRGGRTLLAQSLSKPK